MDIPPYYQDKKFRLDANDFPTTWLERLDESGEPTENYVEVDSDLFQALVENDRILTA